MIYLFQLYDITNTTREAILERVLYAQESATLAGEHTLTIEVSPYADNGDQLLGVDASDPVTLPRVQEGKYVRVFSSTGGTSYFRIAQIETKHIKGEYLFHMTCEHIKYTARDQVIPLIEDYTEISATELLVNCMAYVTGFTIGTNDIPSDVYRDISIKQINLLELLNLICTTYSGTTKYYYTVTSTKVISILSEDNIGTEKEFALVYDGNIKALTRRSDPLTLVNKLYAHSDDGNRLEYADSQKYFNERAGTVLYLGDSETRTLSGDGSDVNCVTMGSTLSLRVTCWFLFDAPYAGYANMDFDVELLDSLGNTVWGEATFTCDDVTAAPTVSLDQVWINIEMGDAANIKKIKVTCRSSATYDGAVLLNWVCQLNEVWYYLAPNIGYVQDSASDSKYGEYAHSVKLEFPRVKNLHSSYHQIGIASTIGYDSTMSGTYTGGIHEGWADLSMGVGVVVSENTDPTYIKNGTKSMRIYCPTKSTALIQTNRYIPGLVQDRSYYSIWNLYVARGAIRLMIEDEDDMLLFDYTTAGVGWLNVINDAPFSPTENTNFRLTIRSASKVSDIYLDSIQIAQGSAPMPFFLDNSADNMKTEAERLLENNKLPKFTFDVNLTDYSKIIPATLDESYDVGDKVLVIDREVHLDDYLRVVKITRNLLGVQNNRLELSNRSAPLSNIISLLAGQKQLLIT
jgi:Prophage endopeptidase tail